MAMCAGVQKVSRPIERCHDTSHAPPTEADVTASTPPQTYHGTPDELAVAAEAACPGPCPLDADTAGLAIVSLS